MPLISEIVLNKNDLLKSLSLTKSLNVEVMKCFNIFFSKKGLIKNIGSYIILSILFVNIILAVLFHIKDYNILLYQIKKIIKTKTNNNEIIKEIKNENINNNFNGFRKKKKKKKKKKSISKN